MKKYYLIEDFDPGLDYQDGQAIPLNPLPLRQLNLRHIPYRIIEEFYEESQLRKEETDFFYRELRWIDQLDGFLQERIDFCRRYEIQLARAYYNRIKYFVNSLIIQSFILHSLVEGIGPGASIVYVRRRKPDSPKTMHHFKFDEGSLCFADLLPVICRKFDVSYRLHEFETREQETEADGSASWFSALKSTSPLKSFYKIVRNFIKHKKYARWMTPAKGDSLRVLFLHSGSHFLDPVIHDFMAQGHQVFVRTDHKICHLNAFHEGIQGSIDQPRKDDEERLIRAQCLQASRNFAEEGKAFMEWVNQECRVDVTPFIQPYFQAFLEINCFELLKQARNLAFFYEKHHIDYVLSHTNSDLTSKSALIAARIVPRVQSVGLQHCSDIYVDRVMHLTEIDPFDFYFTMDGLSEKKFKRYALEDYLSSCAVYQSPHFLQVVGSKSGSPKRGSGERKKILYVPTKLSLVHIRYFNCMVYPILWYLEFQKKLFEFFARECLAFDFIYKQPVVRTKFIEETVVPTIREKNYSNIDISTKTVMDCLAKVDAVIMDRPTTAYSEALMSGRPVLGLYPDFMENIICRDEVTFFGKSCQSFSSPDDAFAKIKDFLYGNPDDYKPHLPLRDDKIVSVLQKSKWKEDASCHQPTGILV